MRGSTNPFTSTSVEAGRSSPEVGDAARVDFRTSVMSVMKTCTLTTCSGPAPAALRHLSIAAVARSNWATTSDGILPSCAWPTTPATQTWVGVGVPGRRLAAGLDTYEVHGEVFEPTAIG